MNTYADIFDCALKDDAVAISPKGMVRRRAMGRMLEAAVISRRRRRRAIRGSAVLALAAAVFWMLLPMTGPRRLNPMQNSSVYEYMALQIVRNQPGIMDRFAYVPAAIPAETWVDDAALIELLDASGHPSGLLRVGGRLMLTNPLEAVELPD